MEKLLLSIGTPLIHHGRHKKLLVKWGLIAPIVKKWSKNRDADLERVKEMKEHFQNGGYLPLLIHLAELQDEGLACYDGNHRRLVFNDFPETLCVIDVVFEAKESEVYKEFENINKAVQVPAIYLKEETSAPKEEILDLVRLYENKYKEFRSTSARPHAPHFNRDTAIDNIHKIYEDYKGALSVKEIADLLDKLNTAYSNQQLCRPHKEYRKSVIDKCKTHTFWLFMDKHIPTEHIQALINMSMR